MRRSMLGWGGAVALGAALMASPASANTFGPAGTQNSHGGTLGPSPSCALRQAWEKRPGALTVQSIAFTGLVNCTAVTSDMSIWGSLTVEDETAPNDGPVIQQSGYWDPQTQSGPSWSLAFTPTLSAPKAGHVYLSTFYVAFDLAVRIDTMPSECKANVPDPFAGPTGVIPQPAVECVYTQRILVP